jgi:hypothetical protein
VQHHFIATGCHDSKCIFAFQNHAMRRGWYMYHYGTRAAYNECNARLDPRIVTTTFTHFVLSDSIWNIYSTGATQILWNTAMRYTRTHTHTRPYCNTNYNQCVLNYAVYISKTQTVSRLLCSWHVFTHMFLLHLRIVWTLCWCVW